VPRASWVLHRVGTARPLVLPFAANSRERGRASPVAGHGCGGSSRLSFCGSAAADDQLVPLRAAEAFGPFGDAPHGRVRKLAGSKGVEPRFGARFDKQKAPRSRGFGLKVKLAGRQGVEPRLSGSEPLVLPLNDLPVGEGGGCYTAPNATVKRCIPISSPPPRRAVGWPRCGGFRQPWHNLR
jgi:hypothetical protein